MAAKTWVMRVLCGAVGALVVSTIAVQPGVAAVPITQTATLVGQSPVTGTYDRFFSNFERRDNPCRRPNCTRRDTGTLRIKLNAYRVKESLKKYDFYLLDVDTRIVGKKSTTRHRKAKATFRIRNSAKNVVDWEDSKSITTDPRKCQSFPVNVGASVGVVSAGIQVGQVTLCHKAAAFTKKASGKNAIYTASQLPRINGLTSGRIVKVKAGTKPTFSVKVTYPADVCTRSTSRGCHQYVDKTASATFKVRTTG